MSPAQADPPVRSTDGFEPHPGLVFDASGAPVDPVFADVFRSRAGAWQESIEIFVEGCSLAERWRGRERFSVLELGFGLGINFLATLQCWRNDPARSRHLDFTSIESRPVSREDLQRALEALVGDRPGQAELLGQWPLRLPGIHQLAFESGLVTLTLVFGEAGRMLPRLDGGIDAFYLDGFAPSRNPQMWEPGLIRGLGRLARPGAVLATWSAAGAIRHALASSGFEVTRLAGFAGKRHRVRAVWAPRGSRWPVPPQTASLSDRRVIVIGAGLAGVAVAEAFARKGFRVTLIDEQGPGCGAGSRQPLLADHPHLSPDDNPTARLTRAALLMNRAYRDDEGRPLAGRRLGRILLAADDADAEMQSGMLQRLAFPDAFARWVDARQSSDIAGVSLRRGGLWVPLCETIEPALAIRQSLGRHADAIAVVSGCRVQSLQRRDDDWVALDAAGITIGRASIVILANAGDVPRLAGIDDLPLRRIRGQTSWLHDPALSPLRTVISGQSYLVPGPHGDSRLLLGASFDDGHSLEPDPRDDLGNLRRLSLTLGVDLPMLPTRLSSAATGFRYTLPDRLPAIGPLHDPLASAAIRAELVRNDRLPIPCSPGLYAAFGLGSRGLLWATLAASLLPAMVCGDPLPLERDLVAALSPSRYLRRRLRRAGSR